MDTSICSRCSAFWRVVVSLGWLCNHYSHAGDSSVAVEIIGDQTMLQVGEPIPLAVRITNHSNSVLEFDVGKEPSEGINGIAMVWFRVEADSVSQVPLNTNLTEVPDPNEVMVSFGGGIGTPTHDFELQRRKHGSLSYCLNEWYHLPRPGRFTVTAVFHPQCRFNSLGNLHSEVYECVTDESRPGAIAVATRERSELEQSVWWGESKPFTITIVEGDMSGRIEQYLETLSDKNQTMKNRVQALTFLAYTYSPRAEKLITELILMRLRNS